MTPPDPPIRIAAYQPEIPGNLGAMIRLGACFGAPVHVIEPCGFPFSVKALRRSAMDYAARAEVVRHDDWSRFEADRPAGRVLLLSTRGAHSIWEFAFEPGDYLTLGRESAGAGPEVWAGAAATLVVPIMAAERSLNVAAAAAIALAQATRRAGGVFSAV